MNKVDFQRRGADTGMEFLVAFGFCRKIPNITVGKMIVQL